MKWVSRHKDKDSYVRQGVGLNLEYVSSGRAPFAVIIIRVFVVLNLLLLDQAKFSYIVIFVN